MRCLCASDTLSPPAASDVHDLTARRAGELAAVWYSGAGADLHWQVCTIQVNDRNPSSTCSTAQRTDAWTKGDPAKDYAPARSVAGEYLPALFLNDGDLAVVTPVQNYTTNHFGFSFWRFKRNPIAVGSEASGTRISEEGPQMPKKAPRFS